MASNREAGPEGIGFYDTTDWTSVKENCTKLELMEIGPTSTFWAYIRREEEVEEEQKEQERIRKTKITTTTMTIRITTTKTRKTSKRTARKQPEEEHSV